MILVRFHPGNTFLVYWISNGVRIDCPTPATPNGHETSILHKFQGMTQHFKRKLSSSWSNLYICYIWTAPPPSPVWSKHIKTMVTIGNLFGQQEKRCLKGIMFDVIVFQMCRHIGNQPGQAYATWFLIRPSWQTNSFFASQCPPSKDVLPKKAPPATPAPQPDFGTWLDTSRQMHDSHWFTTFNLFCHKV